MAVAQSRTVIVSIPSTTQITYDAYTVGCVECAAKALDMSEYSPNLTIVTNKPVYKFQSNGLGLNGTYKVQIGAYYKCITLNRIGRAYIGETVGCSSL